MPDKNSAWLQPPAAQKLDKKDFLHRIIVQSFTRRYDCYSYRRETLLLWSTSAIYIAWTKAILHIKRASLTMPSLFQRAWPKKPAHATKTGIYFTIGNSKSFCIQSVKGNRCMKVSNVGRKPHRKKNRKNSRAALHARNFCRGLNLLPKAINKTPKLFPTSAQNPQ